MTESVTRPAGAAAHTEERAARNARDVRPYLACAAIAMVLAGLTARDVYRQREADARELRKLQIDVQPSVLLAGRGRLLGDARAPYTLVEFGDYECPPCRRTQELVHAAMSRYRGRLKLDFRQHPLSQIHPHALEAALATESASTAEEFWMLHERLFQTDLRLKGAVSGAAKQAGVRMDGRKARKRLDADIALGERLGISATPSFLLCCPDGRVYRLRGIEDLDKLLG